VLTGTNSYAGGTMIADGVLQIGDGGPSGSITGPVVDNRTLAFNRSDDFAFAGAISGTGNVHKRGAGSLTLTGANSYSGGTLIAQGTLIGSASSLGVSQIVNNGALVIDQPVDANFANTINGSGSFAKRGAGNLNLTGTSALAGATTIEAGKLSVNGSLGSSAVTVLSGATLAGSGAVGGVAADAGGTVAPGNSIGTLTVSGNVSFASGSTYQVEVNASGSSDRIAASGSATISGGTVQVLAQTGNYAAATNYTILTASGGVGGSFSGVSSNLAFLTPSLAYDSQNVTLTMTRNDTGFGPDGGGSTGGGSGGQRPYIAQTRNQSFIATAAERLGGGNPVYDTLISATAAEARAGFDLISGEAHAQGVSVMIDESRLVRDTILGHLRSPLLTQAPGQVAGAFSADLPGRKGVITMPAPVPPPRYALWGTAFGSTGDSDGDGNAASLNHRSGGALLGADLMLHDAPGSSLKIGVAGGYSQSRFDLNARLSSGRLESGHALCRGPLRQPALRCRRGLFVERERHPPSGLNPRLRRPPAPAASGPGRARLRRARLWPRLQRLRARTLRAAGADPGQHGCRQRARRGSGPAPALQRPDAGLHHAGPARRGAAWGGAAVRPRHARLAPRLWRAHPASTHRLRRRHHPGHGLRRQDRPRGARRRGRARLADIAGHRARLDLLRRHR
jgi:outer membrane autotransporter protein